MAGGRPVEAIGPEGPTIRGLGPKYVAFVDAYFANGFDATNAGVAVGFNKWYGPKLIKRPSIMQEIKRRQRVIDRSKQRVMEKFDISKERLITEYAKIAFAPVAREHGSLRLDKDGNFSEQNWEEESPEGYAPVAARDKRAALADLAKMEGLFVDKLKVEGEVNIVENLLAGQARVAQKKRLKAAEENEAG